MSPDSLILSNLLIYLIGFGLLLGLRNGAFAITSGWVSLFINILGIIFTSSLLINNPGNFTIQYQWLSLADFSINFGFLLNAQTKFMLILIQSIAATVNLYSTKYMQDDPGINRFFAYLNLFVLSMLGLVLSTNLFQMYFFWELVGFCSYLLIGFWYTKKSANRAAIKAFLLNRFGDAFFLGGILLIYFLYGTFDFTDLEQARLIPREYIFLSAHQLQTLAVLLIFGGVMGKSAQIPLQVWLADAMEGPTPASALIHAATMVVSGIFILGRLQAVITPDAGQFIASIGATTALFGAIFAAFQRDIKKVLAFSTISQLGFMVTAMGIKEPGASFFHLSTHAVFKEGLFLCAGAIISFLHHEQDMRKMGNLIQKIPLIFASFLVCSAALIGLPFTAGFLSKESIINASLSYGLASLDVKMLVPAFLLLSSFLTTFYVIRMVVMVFFEREQNAVELLIDTTKKTVGGAIKSFQDILTADNKNLREDKVIQFVRKIGVYEIVTLTLAVSSLWFVFSSDLLHPENVWFFAEFKSPAESFSWLPWLMAFLILSALLISYNNTLDEIKRYTDQIELSGWKSSFVNAASRQFYMDNFYENTFRFIFFGKDNNGILALFSKVETEYIDAFVLKTGKSLVLISKQIGYFEKNIVDASVMGTFANIKWLGDKIRKSGKGNIQSYLAVLLIVCLFIFLLMLILS